MSNEAIERLRNAVHDDYAEEEWEELIDDALTAAERATVERIRAALLEVPEVGTSYVKRARFLAILEEVGK